jgi:hypothetical protein
LKVDAGCTCCLDAPIAATGRTHHHLGGTALGPASGPAICQYDNDQRLDLFDCDESRAVVTNTVHQSLTDP